MLLLLSGTNEFEIQTEQHEIIALYYLHLAVIAIKMVNMETNETHFPLLLCAVIWSLKSTVAWIIILCHVPIGL